MAMYSISRLRRISTRGMMPSAASRHKGLREKEFCTGEASGDAGDQGHYKRFDQAESAALQRQHDKHVECGDEHSGWKGQAEQQLQRDG